MLFNKILSLLTFFIFFRWFRHITEASNAYKARENRRSYRGPGLGSDSPLSSHNGLVDSVSKSDAVSADSLDLPGDKKGQPAGRSQSFHEHSISNMEPHPERQPSSPPEDLADQDTFASKTGLHSDIVDRFYLVMDIQLNRVYWCLGFV
jgi:hypothetical protein